MPKKNLTSHFDPQVDAREFRILQQQLESSNAREVLLPPASGRFFSISYPTSLGSSYHLANVAFLIHLQGTLGTSQYRQGASDTGSNGTFPPSSKRASVCKGTPYPSSLGAPHPPSSWLRPDRGHGASSSKPPVSKERGCCKAKGGGAWRTEK